MAQKYQSIMVGWDEWVSLPELGLVAILAKVDTGAQTSALHAVNIRAYEKDGVERVKYVVHPLPDRPEVEIECDSQVVGKRNIVSSNGDAEERYIVRTPIRLAGQEWPIELSLTNREDMQYRMLMGRSTMSGRIVVDPDRSMLCGELSTTLYDEIDKEDGQSRKLKIAVLSREPENYSTSRLVDAAVSRGHSVDVINTTRCYMNITSKKPDIHYQGVSLPEYDAIIPRVGASITFYGMAIVRQFEMMGAYTLNSAEAIGASRDKLFAHQILAREGIGMPVTGFAHSPSDVRDMLKSVGKAPLVLKLLEGTQGRGVVLAETQKAAESVIQAFRGLKANILVQEFIAESKGADVRCVVIGNKVVAAMKRQAEEGEFRSNLHQGGSASAVKITAQERAAAVKAAKSLGLRFAGVDLLRSNDGPKVLEVNSSPGLEGVETVTGINIAGQVIEYVERAIHRRRSGSVARRKY
ncbi:30S ribosomal protein S6--L-glutamate ligase [Sneathiella glossodoripedis]|uniref:30S ribosomal protein S6--L-glutamate ligase n=1 Tax=Sneathiella glossodoripedis TaxID=418853 RepID=UPI000472E4CB|nr:30S ribosomal protein S6--L-glutamate ligase [Sneathiella glossodoripedis]